MNLMIPVGAVPSADFSDLTLPRLNWQIRQHERWAIIGQNGVGKSTLLRTVAGLLNKQNNFSTWLQGTPIRNMNFAQLAQKRIWLAQHIEEVFDVSVMHWLKSLCHDVSDDNWQERLTTFGLDGFQSRSVLRLSGGEKQRLLWTLAAARTTGQTALWLLDEPFSAQDISWQLKLLDYLTHMQLPCAIVVHDLKHIPLFATHILMLSKDEAGHVYAVAQGPCEHELHSEHLATTFGISTEQTCLLFDQKQQWP